TDDGEEVQETDEGAVLDEALVAEKTEEYFAKAIPTTVEDLLTIADSFDVPEGVEGVMKWDVSDIFHNYWIVGNYLNIGSDTGDDESSIQIVNDQTVACLKVYQALNQFFSIESDKVTYDSVMDDFVNGRIVFTIGSTDAIKRIEQAKADGVFTHDYGVAVMPNINKMLASRSLSVTNVVAVNSYSKNKELANKFAAFLVDEYAGELYERTGKVASNVKINQDNGALQICMLEYADSISLPKMMEIGNLWLQLEALFAKVWNGEVVTPLLEELSEQISTQIIQ
ncbi:MAG: extracellular solute-binding protein, partial [Lachnospiraceae bacterium]|nr:extracellular solute-binding protein [Lachnospiraceae bacterium]